ncbi:MAG: hypothetical protein ACHQF0_12790 [Chitinophagales bacterium]
MHKITNGKPKFSYPARNKYYEKFFFRPLVRTAIRYDNEDKTLLSISVIYSFSCVFQDKKKGIEPFASGQNIFSVTKDDNLQIPANHRIVFDCVKILENDFKHYLATRTPPIPLIGTLVKPATFESWVNRGVEHDNDFPMN